jgi:hypothetical protein
MIEHNAEKSIIKHASRFRLIGINLFLLGIFWQTVREGRLLELFISTWYMLNYWIRPVKNPDADTGVSRFQQVFYKFDSPDHGVLVARSEGIYSNRHTTIACEYGWPGARILVLHGGREHIFNPYINQGVWHLHAIAYLGNSEFAISTGDSKKILDIFTITPSSLIFRRRVVRFCGGYTGMTWHANDLWVGSDLSERANFIASISCGKKYFLPRDCIREYVINLRTLNDSLLLIITKRLHTYRGHALIFCTTTRRFVASNSIEITEFSRYDPFSS